jgi:hypothetical protein
MQEIGLPDLNFHISRWGPLIRFYADNLSLLVP